MNRSHVHVTCLQGCCLVWHGSSFWPERLHTLLTGEAPDTQTAIDRVFYLLDLHAMACDIDDAEMAESFLTQAEMLVAAGSN